jgi:ribosome maturation factor RimP
MNLGELLEATLPPLGYELVDWEMSPGNGLVRVFIDKPNGVDVEDCARVSRHLTRLFAVESVDFGRLEVSSPGLDRPLRKPADFVRFAGAEADLRLTEPVANSRRLSIPLSGIGKARLVPKIEWRKAT